MERTCVGCDTVQHMSSVEEIAAMYYYDERFEVVDRYYVCSSCGYRQRDHSWKRMLMKELGIRYMERMGYSPADLAYVLQHKTLEEVSSRTKANEINLLRYVRHEQTPFPNEIKEILSMREEIEFDLKLTEMTK